MAPLRKLEKRFHPWREISMFFQGKDEVHRAMRRLVKRLERAKLPYAIMGGMAVFAHRHRRTTSDVDILLTPRSFERFNELFVPRGY